MSSVIGRDCAGPMVAMGDLHVDDDLVSGQMRDVLDDKTCPASRAGKLHFPPCTIISVLLYRRAMGSYRVLRMCA